MRIPDPRRCRWLLLGAGAFVAALLLAPGAARMRHSLAPQPGGAIAARPGSLPVFLIDTHEEIREVYRWATSNASLLQFIPCYCGCAALGHDSNAACYLRGVGQDGTVLYQEHGARCGGCLAVTRDVMALRAAGASAGEIRTAVEAKHGGTGRPTPTLWPPD